jgi:hypothetical protein
VEGSIAFEKKETTTMQSEGRPHSAGDDEEGDDTAYVDSFFLPGGILDPSEDFETTANAESKRQQDEALRINLPPLSENPWEIPAAAAAAASGGSAAAVSSSVSAPPSPATPAMDLDHQQVPSWLAPQPPVSPSINSFSSPTQFGSFPIASPPQQQSPRHLAAAHLSPPFLPPQAVEAGPTTQNGGSAVPPPPPPETVLPLTSSPKVPPGFESQLPDFTSSSPRVPEKGGWTGLLLDAGSRVGVTPPGPLRGEEQQLLPPNGINDRQGTETVCVVDQQFQSSVVADSKAPKLQQSVGKEGSGNDEKSRQIDDKPAKKAITRTRSATKIQPVYASSSATLRRRKSRQKQNDVIHEREEDLAEPKSKSTIDVLVASSKQLKKQKPKASKTPERPVLSVSPESDNIASKSPMDDSPGDLIHEDLEHERQSPSRSLTQQKRTSRRRERGQEIKSEDISPAPTPLPSPPPSSQAVGLSGSDEQEEEKETLVDVGMGALAYLIQIVFQMVAFCTEWAIETYHAITPILRQCFSSICSVSKYLLAFVLIFRSVLGCFMAEVRYRRNGTLLCYMVLLYTPHVFDVYMMKATIPHFMPHLVSCGLMCCLCRPISGSDPSGGSFSRGKGATSGDRLTRSLCKSILWSLRVSAVLLFVLEGFSKDNSAYMLLNPTVRLVVAYSLCLLRDGLILSPLAWFGWSTQVLLVAYFPQRGAGLNFSLIVLGISLIRLVRRLQQAQGIPVPGS